MWVLKSQVGQYMAECPSSNLEGLKMASSFWIICGVNLIGCLREILNINQGGKKASFVGFFCIPRRQIALRHK